MSQASNRRHQLRRLKGRFPDEPAKPSTGVSLTCARCPSKMGRGKLGTLCTFTKGHFKRRVENFQGRVCDTCAFELRRHVDKAGPKMHGAAYLNRQAATPARHSAKVTSGQMAAYMKRLATRADSPFKEEK